MKVREIKFDYGVPPEKSERTKKRIKKKRFRLKLILFLLLAAVISGSLALSPVCNIKTIEVHGSKHYKNEEIIDVTGIVPGLNGFKTMGVNITGVRDILRFRYGKAESNIKKNFPYVKDVSVGYRIPGRIAINVEERTPACFIPYLGTNLVVDNEGYVVDTVTDIQEAAMPVVNGVGFDRYELGQALNAENPESLKSAIRLILAIMESDRQEKLAIYEHVGSIDMSDMKKICILVDSRIMVNLGDLTDLSYKISFLKQIYFKKLTKDDRGYLDFTAGDSPRFVPENKN